MLWYASSPQPCPRMRFRLQRSSRRSAKRNCCIIAEACAYTGISLATGLYHGAVTRRECDISPESVHHHWDDSSTNIIYPRVAQAPAWRCALNALSNRSMLLAAAIVALSSILQVVRNVLVDSVLKV
ncbi:hypothetical protein DAEQUDRAFT_104022 [Daedalea quercina L-15889]|uniref:Uncharacterized protein n=1 Tax=Daedalea quercina L-15889 TaxID=1314783 RepID=A0A165KUX5_9APHY|nr:hypothetical protein DAEQUDRAFT_104022 [Daedalea quercina L-15889]